MSYLSTKIARGFVLARSNASVLTVLIFMFVSAGTFGDEVRRPLQGLRVPSMGLSAFYIPSFVTSFGQSMSPFPWHDNFASRLYFENLIRTGPNLNIYMTANHRSYAAIVLPQASTGGTALDSTNQIIDSAQANVVLSLSDFFQISPSFEYLQNRTVSNAIQFADYRFNSAAGQIMLSYDTRFGTSEPWYAGVPQVYPDHGFAGSIGFTYRSFDRIAAGSLLGVPKSMVQFQALFGVAQFVTLALTGSAQANLILTTFRPAKTQTQVIGAYPAVGDYSGNASVELRFLTPIGVTLRTPPFLVAPFAFRFSPGVLAGYGAGLAGNYGGMPPSFVQSFYLAPLIAVRVNDVLASVVRVDFAFSTYQGGKGFTIDLGTSINSTPSLLWRIDF